MDAASGKLKLVYDHGVTCAANKAINTTSKIFFSCSSGSMVRYILPLFYDTVQDLPVLTYIHGQILARSKCPKTIISPLKLSR